MKWKLVCLLFLVLPLSLISVSGQIPASDWEEDIVQFAEVITENHKNPFTELEEVDFWLEISDLIEALPKLNDAQVKVKLKQICALIGDSHTGLWLGQESLYPLNFSWFSDGIFSTACPKSQPEYLGLKLKGIGELDLDAVLEKLVSIVPHENDAQLMSQIPRFLVNPEVLYGLGITDSKAGCEYLFEKSNGQIVKLQVQEVNKDEFATVKEKMDWLSPEQRPESYHQTKMPYWYKVFDDHNTIFISYNSCRNNPDLSFSKFTSEVLSKIEQRKLQKIIIDLRQNGGGNSMIFRPMLKALKNHPDLNRPEKLIVLTGRRTFSSAVLNSIELRQETNATFVGEPTGGKPNHFGEVKQAKLENSGLTLSYSTKYFSHSEVDSDSFMPDYDKRTSFKDFINGVDPAFEFALKIY